MNMTRAWLKTYDLAVPRYTSYPTAPHFTATFGASSLADHLAQIPSDSILSLYIHMPFCKSLCWYCGCNMKVSRNVEDMLAYSQTVCREISLVGARLNTRLKVGNIHFGGGTPTWGPHEGRAAIMNAIRTAFDVKTDADIAFEADPRSVSDDVALELADLGVNRVSLGVQDFDPGVQTAINRVQSFDVVERAALGLRKAGITNINLDLMYGLPLQTDQTIAHTIGLAMQLAPRRVALFGYAHVPWMKKHQRLLEREPLPNTEQRFALFCTAREKLLDSGFAPIGIDHFAAPDDSMALAAMSGTLRRNFQGYTTDSSPIVLGFGASAISALPMSYAQNDAGLVAYAAAINEGNFATVRGRALSRNDMLRRDVIMSLMCHFRAHVPQDIAESAATALDPLLRDSLCRWEDSGELVMTPAATPWVRVLAACFDEYHVPNAGRHARAV